MEFKTNVMRILDKAKISYESFSFSDDKALSGVEVAELLGQDVAKVYKTLVTVGKSKKYYVFMVPAAEELSLKKAAAAVGEKSIEMIKSKDLLSVAGYIHGGCSPIGMKKLYTTTIHESAAQQDAITFSAGKIGYQVKLSPKDLEKVVPISYKDIIM